MRRLPALALVLCMSLLLGLMPAFASEGTPQWEVTSDTGSLGNDIAKFVGASPSLNMVNQGLDTVFVTGTSSKPPALQNAGLNDLDTGTTAYDAETGAVRWKATYDGGLGVTDQMGAFEVNYHNNLIYEMVNSGTNLVTIERAVRDGKISRSAVYPGASAEDSAISPEGGFLGVVGSTGSQMLVLAYQTGSQTVELDEQPTSGTANSADIAGSGSLDTTRTLLVTGQSSGFGTRGDMYSVAYNYRTGAKLWENSWASPDNRADEGSVAEAAHVTALGKAVGFVAGRTFTPETGWDTLVNAYDLQTGTPIWAEPLRIDGEGSGDDSPTHLVYSDAASTLYLVGTSERGTPHGEDVMTVAIDPVTGARMATAYGAGDAANADDKPTGLAVSKDGTRVFVAADVVNTFATGGQQAALFAYDAGLRPAGQRIVGGAGEDRSAGVALNVAQDQAFLAGSTISQLTGYDHRASSFDVAAFTTGPIEEVVATQIAFTSESATTGQYSDSATLEARLTSDSGETLAGHQVTFSLGGLSQVATTDSAGLARSTFRLDSDPGNYRTSATFAGTEGELEPSQAVGMFEIGREDTALSLVVTGNGSKRTAQATLYDADALSAVAGRTVNFFADGVAIGSAQTDATGKAAIAVPAGYRGGERNFTTTFEGDAYFVGSSASAAG